jgi:hypothetical protein
VPAAVVVARREEQHLAPHRPGVVLSMGHIGVCAAVLTTSIFVHLTPGREALDTQECTNDMQSGAAPTRDFITIPMQLNMPQCATLDTAVGTHAIPMTRAKVRRVLTLPTTPSTCWHFKTLWTAGVSCLFHWPKCRNGKCLRRSWKRTAVLPGTAR